MVAGLTLLALGVRLAGLNQGLFGDELYLYEIAARDDLGAMVGKVVDTESTPPFGFLLPWAAVKLGDPTVTVRLPSLLLGTAVVPLAYLLGRRTVGAPAALLGAAFMALSPFAIWYSDESRAYATMTFLAVLSTLALVLALQTRRRGWWVVYAVAACLVLYTHYMGVFVVIVQAAWATVAHRDRWRELALAHAAVVLGYLPWLPSFVIQSDDTSAQRISTFKDFTPKGAVRELTISVIGHPFLSLESAPGRAALALFGLGVAAAVAGALVHVRARRAVPGVRSPAVLVALVALATPAGVAVYSVLGQNAYIPRNLSASLPALALVLAAGLVALRRPAAVVAGLTAVVVALGIGATRTLDPDNGRPPYRQAAELVDERDGGGAAVVEYPLFPAFANVDIALGRHLENHFGRSHELLQVRSPDSPGWDEVPAHDQLFVVTPWDAAHRAGGPPLPPRFARRFRFVRNRVWPGLVPVAVFEYRARG